MTPQKILAVISEYENVFRALGITPGTTSHDDLIGPDDDADVLAHCYGMLAKIRMFVAEGRTEKVMRWLGFVQGCLWSHGIFTLAQLMEHSRPETA